MWLEFDAVDGELAPNAIAGVLIPMAAIMATATTPRVLNFFIWTPFKGTVPTVEIQFLKSL
jgi:hypothetical protein